MRRGSLLVIPCGRALLYAEPIYLQAERSPMPELRLVVLALAVGMACLLVAYMLIASSRWSWLRLPEAADGAAAAADGMLVEGPN